jgi:hypothetical protein
MRHTTTAPSRLARPLGAIAAVLAIGLPGSAWAIVSGDLAVQVLVGGQPSHEYQARGTTYVEALHGAEYSVRLSNRSGIRIAVALAVDGVNSIDARTTSAAAAAKWVLDPWETVTINGWQTSQQSARRFVFTTEPDSYGAWLGRTDNLGVIEAVVFRERPLAREFVDPPMPSQQPEAGAGREQAGAAGPMSGQDKRSAASAPSEEHAATGIGRRVDHPVRRVELDLEPEPSSRVRIRYEYRPQLVALGALPLPPLPDPLERREHARGFSDSGFCPDPYGRR